MSIWRIWLRSSDGRKTQRLWRKEYEEHKTRCWNIRITTAALKVLHKHLMAMPTLDMTWEAKYDEWI